MNMRRLFLSLPWELLGDRPALISLTYPGKWQGWVKDGRALEAHRRAFERRWVRRWGSPLVGVWVKEFQESGAPHLHLYVGLPEQMSAEDFAGLRERTKLRHRLEREFGKYEGRAKNPPIGGEYGGEFGTWLGTAWAGVVGTQGRERNHQRRGADVAVMFWSDEVELTADRTKIPEYLAREASKRRQKKPPPGFKQVGRYYGTWGRDVGFVPQKRVLELDSLVAREVERRLARWVTWKLRLRRVPGVPREGLLLRNRGDGVTAFGLTEEQAYRVLGWAEAAARRKIERRGGGSGGVAPAKLQGSSDLRWTWRLEKLSQSSTAAARSRTSVSIGSR
jgi:hypothetical protein